MAKPDKTERFKVTEREAGTGRVVHEMQGDVPVLSAASPSDGAKLEGFEGPVNPLAVDPYIPATSVPATGGGVSAAEVLPTGASPLGAASPVDAIRRHPDFVDHMKRIHRAELSREFCCHGIDHLLDVARIAYIRVLERKMPFRKETVYAAALLHDLGKAEQYEHGEPHEVAGARVATNILMDIDGFSALEKTAIVAAVAQHRCFADDASPLGKLLYEADKVSRPCYACVARERCDWLPEKMNVGIKI